MAAGTARPAGIHQHADYRRKVLGPQADKMEFCDEFAVTWKSAACQYFPWVIVAARRAIGAVVA